MPDMHFDLSAKSDDYSQHDDKNMNEDDDAGSFTSIQNVDEGAKEVCISVYIAG